MIKTIEMKNIFLSLIASALLMPLTASAQTDEQYNDAITNITNGNYRIYAEVSGTKYYLKDVRTNSGNEVDFVQTTTIRSEASVFAVSQVSLSGLKSTPWLIASNGYGFTNPSGGVADDVCFTAGTCLRGYKLSYRDNVCDRQVLYFDGSAYAVRSTNKADGYWGGAAYWGIDDSKNACYTTGASFVWHFEAIAAVADITTGKYLVKGANASWAGKGSEPYWINDGKDMFCLWNDVAQATTFDVVKAGDELYFYDSAKKKWLMHNGSAWLSTPNTVGAFYAQKQTYNGDEYFALATETGATFGTDSKFCKAESTSSSHSRNVDGYSYSFTGYGCVDGSGKSGDDDNPDALWSFVEKGNSTSTTFDLSSLRVGIPGLVAALKTAATGNVSYTLTVTEAEWATLCLPYAATIPAGITAVYTLAFNGTQLKATAVETTLPANTPVLVKASAGTYTFSAACSTIAEAVATPTSGALTGTFAYNGSLANAYILQKQGDKVGFYSISDTHAIHAFRAYIPKPVASNARSLDIVFDDDETTGIETVNGTEPVADGYYSISGQRIALPKKGMYIMNGKKVIIK